MAWNYFFLLGHEKMLIWKATLDKMIKFRPLWSVTIFRHTLKKKVMFSFGSIMNSPTLLLFQLSPDNCIEHVHMLLIHSCFMTFFACTLHSFFITHNILSVQYMQNAFMISLYPNLNIASTIKT